MRFARPENGVVQHTLNVPPENIYPPSYAILYLPCSDEVEVGWTYDGTNWAAPVPPPLTAHDFAYEVFLAQQAHDVARRYQIVDEVILQHGTPGSKAQFNTWLEAGTWLD